MDLESILGQAVLPTPGLAKHHSTPPTTSTPNSTSLSFYAPSTSEFTLEAETHQLTQLMRTASLDDKENEKHSTDRFIPLRKHRPLDAALTAPDQ